MQKQNDSATAAQADEFERQLEERISAMEQEDYNFPARFSKKDYISVALVAAACLVLIIINYPWYAVCGDLFASSMINLLGFTSVPFDYIMNFRPQRPEGEPNIIPYIMSVEANFAFVITLVGGMAEIPRVTKTERCGNARHYAGHDGGIQGGRRRNLHHSGLRQCPCTGSFHRTRPALCLLLCGIEGQRPR